MKSPFPSMDPFMELRWQDVHNSLVIYIRDQIQTQLPDDLVAQVDERVVLEFGEDEFTVSEPAEQLAVAARQMALGDVAQPDAIQLGEFDLPETESFIENLDYKKGYKVKKMIELVSPTNKLPGKGRESYLEKQSQCYKAGVNLVEIDLTREGDRTAVMPWSRNSELPQPTYLAAVWRALDRQNWQRDIYRLPLEQPLKPIAIPLRPGDPDVTLRLQPLVERAYEMGRHFQINYRTKLQPPLSAAEMAFLDQRLAQRN